MILDATDTFYFMAMDHFYRLPGIESGHPEKMYVDRSNGNIITVEGEGAPEENRTDNPVSEIEIRLAGGELVEIPQANERPNMTDSQKLSDFHAWLSKNDLLSVAPVDMFS